MFCVVQLFHIDSLLFCEWLIFEGFYLLLQVFYEDGKFRLPVLSCLSSPSNLQIHLESPVWPKGCGCEVVMLRSTLLSGQAPWAPDYGVTSLLHPLLHVTCLHWHHCPEEGEWLESWLETPASWMRRVVIPAPWCSEEWSIRNDCSFCKPDPLSMFFSLFVTTLAFTEVDESEVQSVLPVDVSVHWKKELTDSLPRNCGGSGAADILLTSNSSTSPRIFPALHSQMDF